MLKNTNGNCKTIDRFHIVSVGIVKNIDNTVIIEIYPEYMDGLLGLDQFSYILVFFRFHKNDTPEQRSILQVHPRGDKANPLTGFFATRSSVRPNPIGMSVCKILCIYGNMIHIDQIDALNESPIIDIKPYIPRIDAISDAKTPVWAGDSGVELWNKVKK